LIVISFLFCGTGGAVGGWLVKFVRPERIKCEGIGFGIIGGVLAYFILVIVVMVYLL